MFVVVEAFLWSLLLLSSQSRVPLSLQCCWWDLVFCGFMSLLSVPAGLAGCLSLMEPGDSFDPGGGAGPVRNTVLLGPIKTPCDQSLGYCYVLPCSPGLLDCGFMSLLSVHAGLLATSS
jgi:hypothetical protein